MDITATFTEVQTETATVTVTAAAKARRHEAPVHKRVTVAKPTATAKELISLKALASSVIATACSCINTTPTLTVSSLSTLSYIKVAQIFQATSTKTLTAQTTTLTTSTLTRAAQTTVTSITTLTVTATVAPLLSPGCPNPSDLGCSFASPCGGGNDGTCICERTTEGINVCVDYTDSFACPNPIIACTSSAQCGNGYSCVTSTCCGVSVCFSTATSLGNTCQNVPATVIRLLRGRQVVAMVGLPVHLPPQ
jgi:hypothetical protein